MNYIPLRVYSVFSQGAGAVDAASLAEIMQQAGMPYLPLCDPMALTGWERFKQEAGKRQMKPVLGTEIILPEKGSLLLFPLSQTGYLSLVSCLNRRALPALHEVLAIFLPRQPDAVFLRRLQKKIGRGSARPPDLGPGLALDRCCPKIRRSQGCFSAFALAGHFEG
jgi:hypothetical protein